MTDITPEALEALSKKATQGLDHAAIYKEARARMLRDATGEDFDFHQTQVIAEHVLRQALPTGQLIPAPSVEKEPSNTLVAGFRRAGFMMTETHRVGEYRARKLVIGFENPDDADDMLSIIRKALKDAD